MILPAAQVRDVGWDSDPVGGRAPHACLLVMEEAAAQQGQAQSLQQNISTTLRVRDGMTIYLTLAVPTTLSAWSWELNIFVNHFFIVIPTAS